MMKTRLRGLTAAALSSTALAVSALTGAAPATALTPTVCMGTVSGKQTATSTDFFVPEGATCTLKQVTGPYGYQFGNVTVSKNARLNMVGGHASTIKTVGDYATVWLSSGADAYEVKLGTANYDHSVVSGVNAELAVRDSKVYTVSSPAAHRNIYISNSKLSSLTADGGRSVTVVNGSQVSSNVTLQNLRGDSTFSGSTANSYKFSLGKKNSRVYVNGSTFPGRNWDGHGLEVRTSHMAYLRNNQVLGGNLRLAKNRGTVDVSANIISAALACDGNLLKPVANPKNRATTKTGQCSDL